MACDPLVCSKEHVLIPKRSVSEASCVEIPIPWIGICWKALKSLGSKSPSFAASQGNLPMLGSATLRGVNFLGSQHGWMGHGEFKKTPCEINKEALDPYDSLARTTFFCAI